MKKHLILYVLFFINLAYTMNVFDNSLNLNYFHKLSTFVKNKSEIFSVPIINFSNSLFDKISNSWNKSTIIEKGIGIFGVLSLVSAAVFWFRNKLNKIKSNKKKINKKKINKKKINKKKIMIMISKKVICFLDKNRIKKSFASLNNKDKKDSPIEIMNKHFNEIDFKKSDNDIYEEKDFKELLLSMLTISDLIEIINTLYAKEKKIDDLNYMKFLLIVKIIKLIEGGVLNIIKNNSVNGGEDYQKLKQIIEEKYLYFKAQKHTLILVSQYDNCNDSEFDINKTCTYPGNKEEAKASGQVSFLKKYKKKNALSLGLLKFFDYRKNTYVNYMDEKDIEDFINDNLIKKEKNNIFPKEMKDINLYLNNNLSDFLDNGFRRIKMIREFNMDDNVVFSLLKTYGG